MTSRDHITIIVKAVDEASATLERVRSSLGLTAKQASLASMAMLAAGMGIVASLALCVKSAAEEEAGIKRLAIAMHNVGIEYDDVRQSLEAWIDVQQQKTAVADGQQRESLAQLILSTKDLTEAQDMLTLAMDIAAGTGRDLSSATTLVQYALSDNWGMIQRYLPAIKEATTTEEKWMVLRAAFQGQAEAFGQTMQGQYRLLMANISDIKEAVGSVLLPVVQTAAEWFNKLAQFIKSLDPTLVKIGVVAAAVGAEFLILGGGMLFVLGKLPVMIAGFHALTGAMSSATEAAIALNAATSGLLRAFGMFGIVAGAAMLAGHALGGAIAGISTRISEDLEPALEAAGVDLNQFKVDLEGLHNALPSVSIGFNQLSGYIARTVENMDAATLAAAGLTGGIRDVGVNAQWMLDAEKQAADIMGETNLAIRDQEIASFYAANEKRGMADVAKRLGITETELKAAIDRANQALEAQENQTLATTSALIGLVAAQSAAQAGIPWQQAVYGAAGVPPTYEEAVAALQGRIAVGRERGRNVEELIARLEQLLAMTPEEYLRWVQGAAAAQAVMMGYQYGGVVSGPIGKPQVAIVHGGETVLPHGLSLTIPVSIDGREIARIVINDVSRELRLRGY